MINFVPFACLTFSTNYGGEAYIISVKSTVSSVSEYKQFSIHFNHVQTNKTKPISAEFLLNESININNMNTFEVVNFE